MKYCNPGRINDNDIYLQYRDFKLIGYPETFNVTVIKKDKLAFTKYSVTNELMKHPDRKFWSQMR